MDGWGIVDILYSPKGRGGLNPSLVDGLIPHLEAVNPAYLRDFDPKSLLSL